MMRISCAGKREYLMSMIRTTWSRWLHPALRAIAVLGFAISATGPAAAAGGGAAQTDPGAMESKHFDSKGKLPSRHTIGRQEQLRGSLPFDDERDFEEQKRGFIASPGYKQIMAEAGHVAWDMGSYEWLLQGKGPTRSTRCADSTWRISASSKATRAGSFLTR
jgi:hypothetical protein